MPMVTQVLIMLNILTPRRDSYSPRAFLFFFLPTTLALLTSLFVLIYISFTSSFFFTPPHHFSNGPSLHLLSDSPNDSIPGSQIADAKERVADDQIIERSIQGALRFFSNSNSNGSFVNDNEVFYDRDIFMENYKEMNRSLKIYVYPHQQDEPFANVLLPVDFEPGGNYASESYFKKVLMKSHFITKDPLGADLFFLPFSVARLRHDPRVGVNGIQDFTKSYISNISREYHYWNRSGGSDHFYVAAIPSAVLPWRRQLKLELTPSKLCARQVITCQLMFHIKMHPYRRFGQGKIVIWIRRYIKGTSWHFSRDQTILQYAKGY